MKKLFSLMMLCACMITAQAYNYSVTLSNAHWDFENTTYIRPTATNAAFAVPDNWKTGTSIVAYMPYILPKVDAAATEADRGYNSRHCLYMQNPSSASRVPVYAMMPQVTDKQYSNLKLEFYARTFNSSMDVQTSNTVYGDWKLGYLTSLDDTVKANFKENVQLVDSFSLTPDWAKYSYPLTNVPNGAYLVFYVMDARHIRYMFLDDVAFVEDENTTPQKPTITYSLTHYTAVPGNPTQIDDDETDELNMAFVVESGYMNDSISVTLGGVAIDDLMQNYYADPYYYTTIGHDTLYLTIGAMEDYLTEDIVVTLVGKEIPAPVVTPIAGPATFEEYQAVLPASGDKYDPNTADGTSYWQSGDYTFSCTSSWGGMMHDGFYAANYSDTTYTSYTDDYKALPCQGALGSSTYCSMYYGGSWGGPCTIKCSERTITGTYVVLAMNPYLCIHGRSWSAAFADGDYLYLHLMGKKEGVYTGTSVDCYLADYRDGKRVELTTWTWLNLTALGVVDEVEVVMYDSQMGAGVGLYACFDNLGGDTPVPSSLENVAAKEEARKVLENGQIRIQLGEHIYNTSGQLIR